MQTGLVYGKKLEELLKSIVDPYEERLMRGLYYEVRIGSKVWQSTQEQNVQEISMPFPQKLIISPGREVVVQSWERMKLPANVFVTINPEDLLISKGILSISSGFVLPNTSGYIFFTLSNLSDDNVEIEQGDSLANIFFYILEDNFSTEHKIAETPPVAPKFTKAITTHPELVARVDVIEEQLELALKNDHILIDLDIKQYSPKLIIPLEDSKIIPDGYQLSVGDRADVFLPQKSVGDISGGRVPRYITSKKPLVILPGNTVIIRTQEQIILPDNVSVTLSSLSNLSRKYLNFDARVISPGYRGYVWCNIHNYGTSSCELSLGEPILHAKFVKLGSSATRPVGFGLEPEKYSVIEIPENDIPYPPTAAWDDLVVLTQKVSQLEEDVKSYGPTKQIIEFVFMAVIAGIIVSVFLSLLQVFFGESYLGFSFEEIKPIGIVIGVVIVAVINIYLLFVVTKIYRKRR